MLMHLLTPFAKDHIFFNLFTYLTFRAAGAMVTQRCCIRPGAANDPLAAHAALRPGRARGGSGDAPEEGRHADDGRRAHHHFDGHGDAALGGHHEPIRADHVLVFVWLGALGFLDDYLKVVRRRTEGLVGRYKLIGQGMIGLLVGACCCSFGRRLRPVPAQLDAACRFCPTTTCRSGTADLHAVGDVHRSPAASNAVNLTDGLDGLAGGLTAIAAATFGVFAYLDRPDRHVELSRLVLSAGRGRAGDLLRRAGGRDARLPLVQRAPGGSVHG